MKLKKKENFMMEAFERFWLNIRLWFLFIEIWFLYGWDCLNEGFISRYISNRGK